MGFEVQRPQTDATRRGLSCDYGYRKAALAHECLTTDYIFCFVNNSMVNFYNIAFTATIMRRQFFPCHLDIKHFNENARHSYIKLGPEQAVLGLHAVLKL